MRRSSTVWRSGVLAAGLAIAAASLAAQNFTESTEVVVVEVPVQVVRDGEPVRGLTAADFELFEGRKKLPITGFEVLDLTSAAAAQGAEPPPITARRHFLVLFDLSFSDPKAIIQARKAAHDMVAGLHPTDLVAVATYSSKGPQIALGFTPDRRQIGMAIETLGAPELVDRNLGARDPLRLVVAGAESEMATYTTLNGGQIKGGGVKESTLEAVVETMQGLQEHSDRANATAQKQRISALTRSFSDLARMMAAVEGRKYVVYLSEGFDSSLLQGSQDDTVRSDQSEAAIRGDIQDVSSETLFGDSKSLNEVESMLEEFRRADCTVQAVDIGGLRAEGEQGARRTGGKDSLLQIAKGTGGELFENTNDLGGAMQSMLKRTSVTYVLAFQPDKLKWDGSYHRLKVELKNQPRGTRVIHRPGFYAPKTFTAQNPVEKMMNAADALVSGEDSGTIKMSVLAAPFKVSGDKAYVPVVLEVDGPSLLANTTGTALPAELYIYAMDTGGAVHDFVAQTLGLDVAKAGAQLRQGGLKFFGHVDLYPGDYTIRVMVRNGATGASSLRVVPVRVPAFAEAGPFLLPPFFPETPGRWLMAREAPREGTAQNVPYPFMQDQQPYVPASKPTLVSGQEFPVSLVAYNLGAGDLKAQAKVLSLDGKEMGSGDLKLLGREAGTPDRLKASFKPPALQPGEYRLQVTLVDASGATHTSTTPFDVGGGGKAAR